MRQKDPLATGRSQHRACRQVAGKQQQQGQGGNKSATQQGEGPDAPHLKQPGDDYDTPGGPVGMS